MLLLSFACLSVCVSKAGLTVQLGQNFTASTLFVDNVLVIPPDTDGAIGPNHFVEFINGQFAVFDKSSGTRVQTMSDSGFWINAGISFGPGVNVTDPRIIYDTLSSRWFASQIDFNPNNLVSNRFLLAVSTTADPTGAWKAVAFPADPAGNFADYPRLGLDAKGVYLTGNMFDATENFIGVLLTSIPKADLLLSTPTAANRTCSGVLPQPVRGFTLQPVVNFNPTNDAEIVLAVPDDGINFLPQTNLTTFQVLGAQAPAATFSASTSIPVPSYLVNINPPQPDGQSTLDDGDARIGSYVFQSGNVLYATHAVQVGPRAAIRWYRLDALNNSLLESGTISDTNLDLFYPSIAVGTNGFVVIGFNGCSLDTFVSSYAVAGQTINGTTVFGEKVLLQAGVANYQRFSSSDPNHTVRWGDYSTTTVDAANPNHFWTIQEFPSATDIWSTQVTELIVSEVPPVLQIAASGNSVVLSWSTNDFGFTLQSTPSVSPTVTWSPVTNLVSVVGDHYTVNVVLGNGNQFFRLER